MKTGKIFTLLFLFCLALPFLVWGGPKVSPVDQVKSEIDQGLAILKNPKLKPHEKTEEILKIVDKSVDWHEVAKRVLGIRWRRVAPEQREKFTGLFKEFVKANYANSFEKYSGEKVEYGKQEIDEPYSRVFLKIHSKIYEKPISMECRLIDKEGKWMIYDMLTEGVSMVNNYRVQINNILVNSSFDKMLETLRKKAEKLKKTA
jgi:phospholipid transport system substrate-binding protein